MERKITPLHVVSSRPQITYYSSGKVSAAWSASNSSNLCQARRSCPMRNQLEPLSDSAQQSSVSGDSVSPRLNVCLQRGDQCSRYRRFEIAQGFISKGDRRCLMHWIMLGPEHSCER